MRGNPLYYATGLSVISAFVFVVFVLAFHEIPKDNRELFIHLMGIIEGAFVGGIVSSFFGSSKREHDTHDADSQVTITKTESKE
jgi:hypothetical protein